MEDKQCSICGDIKAISAYYERHSSLDGYRNECKICLSERSKTRYKNNSEHSKQKAMEWYMNNKAISHQLSKEWVKANPEKRKEIQRKHYSANKENKKIYQRLWAKNNPDKVKIIKEKERKKHIEIYREYHKKLHCRRYKTDNKYRLNHLIRGAIHASLKGKKEGRHWEDIVGYTLSQLMVHLENNFKDGMNWDNQGKWHIDHKKPISSFKYHSYDDDEFRKCWTLTNLQPLWAHDNLTKHAKIIEVNNG
ncbi:MAG TPA: hypothetical protein VI727_07935 [Candidatus Brocadiaceae bacterium]|nr:hypothetical protein [Candidatus Brocadiaceae bacterium]